jgi:hypothetical protein
VLHPADKAASVVAATVSAKAIAEVKGVIFITFFVKFSKGNEQRRKIIGMNRRWTRYVYVKEKSEDDAKRKRGLG